MKQFSTLLVTAAAFISCSLINNVFAEEEPAAQKEFCLGCHGPIEKLTDADIKFKVDGGTVNPHKFVPHDSKNLADFPDCTVCHKPHAMPPSKGYKDVSANVEVCYQCHHNYTFQRCSKCHE